MGTEIGWQQPKADASKAVALLEAFARHLAEHAQGPVHFTVEVGQDGWKALRNELRRPYRPEPSETSFYGEWGSATIRVRLADQAPA